MPTFDFECKKCGHVFEYTRAFGSKEHPPCPACKSKRTEKLLTPPTVHFKGAGFYKTDASRVPTPKKKAEPPAGRSPSEDGKKEAKPESKETPKTPPPAQPGEKKD